MPPRHNRAELVHMHACRTDASSSHSRPPLLALPPNSLQQVLRHLPASALVSLACTCKELHAVMATADVDIWRRAAAGVLVPRHPALHARIDAGPEEVKSLRQAMQRHFHACKTLATGARKSSGTSHWITYFSVRHGQRKDSCL